MTDQTSDRTIKETKGAEPTAGTADRGAALEATVGRIEQQVALLVQQQRETIKALNLIAARLLPSSVPAPQPAPAAPAAPVMQDPLIGLVSAVAAAPSDPRPYNDLALRLISLGRAAEAEPLLQEALKVGPRVAFTHTTLAAAYRALGRIDDAIKSLRDALALDWRAPMRQKLSELLVEQGRADEAFALWEEALRIVPHESAPLRESMGIAQKVDRLDLMEKYAFQSAAHACSTRYWPERTEGDPPYAGMTPHLLKAPKLRHDLEQMTYLREKGILGDEFDPIVAGYRAALARVSALGDLAQVPLEENERRAMGHVYNRIIHVTPAPRVKKALSYEWDMAAIERQYVENPPGIIAIDNLLSQEALESLRRFCVESTIWSIMRYENGYLGAFISDGFNTPLLTQIVEELRAAMPRVIGKRTLTNMWGFKYDQEMRGINLHADPAAVNVNFWLTPDDANLDEESGGLIVYDVEAPQDWGFNMYNGGRSNEDIQAFLDRVKARPVVFPYKQNRAVIFNSDLFHRTAPFQFKPGYANRRVNVTMLYGARNDQRLDASAKR